LLFCIYCKSGVSKKDTKEEEASVPSHKELASKKWSESQEAAVVGRSQ